MKRYKNELVAAVFLLIGCMFWGSAVGKHHELVKSCRGISLRFETNPVTIEKLEEIRRRQADDGRKSRLTAWKQDYNLMVEDTELGLWIKSDIIYMWGDGKNLPGLSIYSGCAISLDKAYELWGSGDILGKTVYVDKIPYKVNQVTDSITGIIAVKKDNYEKDTRFVSLDMEPESAEDQTSILIEEFILENSQDADLSINYSDLLSVLENFLIFPAFIASVLIFVKILSRLHNALKNKKRSKILVYVFILIFWISICFFAGRFFFTLPESFIPTKWSDFDFWSNLAKKYKNNLKNLRLMKGYALDDYFRKNFILVSVWSILSSACLASALRLFNSKSLNMLVTAEGASAVIMFFAAVATDAPYGVYSRAYWFILPMCFAVDFFLNNFNRSERI